MMEAKSTFITGLTKTFNKQPKKLYSYISSLSDNRPNMQYIMYKGSPLSDMLSTISLTLPSQQAILSYHLFGPYHHLQYN